MGNERKSQNLPARKERVEDKHTRSEGDGARTHPLERR